MISLPSGRFSKPATRSDIAGQKSRSASIQAVHRRTSRNSNNNCTERANEWGKQCLANGSELGGFVAALYRASAVKTFGPQQDRRPALPLRHDIFRLKQVE